MLFVPRDRTFLRGLAKRVLEIGGEHAPASPSPAAGPVGSTSRGRVTRRRASTRRRAHPGTDELAAHRLRQVLLSPLPRPASPTRAEDSVPRALALSPALRHEAPHGLVPWRQPHTGRAGPPRRPCTRCSIASTRASRAPGKTSSSPAMASGAASSTAWSRGTSTAASSSEASPASAVPIAPPSTCSPSREKGEGSAHPAAPSAPPSSRPGAAPPRCRPWSPFEPASTLCLAVAEDQTSYPPSWTSLPSARNPSAAPFFRTETSSFGRTAPRWR